MSPLRRRRRPSEAVADNEAIPAGPVDDDEAAALRAAIELRAAQTAADLPAPEFVEGLRRRLGEMGNEGAPSAIGRRRFLAAAGAGAVAAGAAGIVADRALLRSDTPDEGAAGPLQPNDGAWVRIAGAGDVGGRTVRFTTGSMAGFVSERDGDLVAVSGACTHQGCLLRLNDDAGRLDCPCHRTAFDPNGRVLFHQLAAAPRPLPRLQVRRNGDDVEVLLPQGDQPHA
ncbi:MAG: Rieske (2Fe-2S) protein [Actinobacteria bacterium]|nr:Rieske (2Fe-2S) protein [Actinomycetota bacterium]